MNPSVYIQIAKSAIQARFDGIIIDKEPYIASYPELTEKKACFVTLTFRHQLRGCIGSIIAHQSLIDDLISNAVSAAFHDPRFPPLSREEFSETTVEVSLLTHPKEVIYTDRDHLFQIIRPYLDGVILRLNNHQATFLPQVWDDLNDFDTFFAHLGLKAGIGNNPLAYHPEIYTYQVDKFKEKDDDEQ